MIESKCKMCKIDIIIKTPKTKFCRDCRKLSDKYHAKLWKKSNHTPVIKKCKWCVNLINGENGRLYCSHSCRTKTWGIKINIVKMRRSLLKKQTKLMNLEEKYVHLF